MSQDFDVVSIQDPDDRAGRVGSIGPIGPPVQPLAYLALGMIISSKLVM